VIIRANNPHASSVAVAGSFNGWNREVTKMRKDETGVWRIELRLPVGYYEYKLIIDGEWCPEQQSERTAGEPVGNLYGTMNRILIIE
jgi:1,4-alpha-glucan branching enzyme